MNERGEVIRFDDADIVFTKRMDPKRALGWWHNVLDVMERYPEEVAYQSGVLVPSADHPEEYRNMLARIFNLMPIYRQANVVVWNTELFMAVVNGAEEAFTGLPLEEDDVPLWPEVWVFDETYSFADAVWDVFQVPEHRREVGALLVFPSRDGHDPNRFCLRLGYFMAVRQSVELPSDSKAFLPMVRFLPMWGIGEEEPIKLGFYRSFLAARRFMQMPITETVPVPLNHQDRKPYKRAGIEPPEVRVVSLRRRETAHQTAKVDAAHRDYSCHFLVGGLTGFWRKGKTFSDGRQGKPEFVSPYVKGDKAKPFKAPTTTVYKVER